MSASDVSVFYLANAGVYLCNEETGILIDGLFESYPGFDPMPEFIETNLLSQKAPFTHLTDLCFTHNHPDHYSARKTDAFLKQYPKTGFYLPQSNYLPRSNYLPQSNYLPDSGSCEEKILLTASQAVLYPIPTRHLLDKKMEVSHRAFFLDYGQKLFFFSGDSDPVYLYKNLSVTQKEQFRSQVDAAFINPFFLSLSLGRRFLDEMEFPSLYVYHMPLQTPDTLRYHEILELGLKRCSEKKVTPLLHFMSQIR